MPNYVALLRGINLGKRRLKMERLRELFEELKFTNVATFIASGNVMFDSKVKGDRKVAETIEAYLEKSLGYTVDTFVRTRDEIEMAVAHPAFPKPQMNNSAHTLHLGFLREAPSPEVAKALMACRTDVDEFHVNGRELYWLCRIKTNESKVWTSPQMRALKLPSATMRNITSLRKLLLAWKV